MENEVWRTVKNFDGFYEVSDQGRIKSLTINVKQYGYKRFYLGVSKGKILTPEKDKNGYESVLLHKDGVKQRQMVHCLVGDAFPEICGEHLPGYEISHLDENPANNKATNLRWVSHTDNINWGTRTEKARKSLTNHTSISKPVLQYTLTGVYVTEYPSAHEAERINGFTENTVSRCCSGKRKTAYGYIWKYKNPSV